MRVGASAPCGEGTRERINHCALWRRPNRREQTEFKGHDLFTRIKRSKLPQNHRNICAGLVLPSEHSVAGRIIV